MGRFISIFLCVTQMLIGTSIPIVVKAEVVSRFDNIYYQIGDGYNKIDLYNDKEEEIILWVKTSERLFHKMLYKGGEGSLVFKGDVEYIKVFYKGNIFPINTFEDFINIK